MKAIAVACVLVLFGSTAFAEDVAPEGVRFRADDGGSVAGALWRTGRKGAAGVVAIAPAGTEPAEWQPFALAFVRAGMDFLALDARDGENAKESWRDALAGRRFLVSRGTDRERVGLLGTGKAAGVALAAARRESAILGTVLLDAEPKLVGLEGDSRIAVIDRADVREGPAAPEVAPGYEQRTVGWFADRLGAPVALDGVVSDEEASAPFREWETAEGKSRGWLAVHGRWLYAAFRPEKGPAPERFLLAFAPDGDAARARAVLAIPSDDGFVYEEQRLVDGEWVPVKARKAAGARRARAGRGEAFELLIPLGEESYGIPSGGATLRVAFARNDSKTGEIWFLPPGEPARPEKWPELRIE